MSDERRHNTIDEVIEIAQAAKEGRHLAFRLIGYPESQWELRETENPARFDFGSFQYRIVAPPKLRPWTPEEAVGKVVRRKDRNPAHCYVITFAAVDFCRVDSRSDFSYETLLFYYEQLDGSPCGVVEGGAR